LCGHLDCTKTIYGSHLLAGYFSNIFALKADDQLITSLPNLRAGSLHNQHFAVVSTRPWRLQRGSFFLTRLSCKFEGFENLVANVITRLTGKAKEKLPFPIGLLATFRPPKRFIRQTDGIGRAVKTTS